MSKFHLITWLCLLLSGCQTLPVASPNTPPIRFLLTFDDGPSAAPRGNTTLQILQQLDHNGVQPGIKALFFVQTRNAQGGGTERGQSLLHFKHHIGHALGLHSGTERGHIRHTSMSPKELSASLRHGCDDLRTITGDETRFIRPTFWGYNKQSVDIYAANGLSMLLTDVNTRDGSRFNNLFGLRNRVYKELQHAQQAIVRGQLPEHRGVVPIVVSFHDLNPITAFFISNYLKLLTDEATAAGLRLADKPFYDTREEILEVAALRAVTPSTLAQRDILSAPAPVVRATTAARVTSDAFFD